MPTVHVDVPYEPHPDLRRQLFEDLGTVPEIVASSRSVEDLPAYVLISTFLGQFVTALAGQFGADAAGRLGRALGRLRTGGGEPGREIRISCASSGVIAVLTERAALDDRAMRELLGLDFTAFRRGTELHWDADARRWRTSRR